MEAENTRISDAERDEAVERLRQACAEGRLTLEEFTERTGIALSARTRAPLTRVVGDLPEQAAYDAAGAPGAAPAPRLFAVGDDLERSGRRVVDDGLTALAVLGDINLDLRESYFPAGSVTVDLRTVLGSIRVWVPAGIGVDVRGFAYLGKRTVETAPARPGAPMLRINAVAMPGSIRVSNNRRRGRVVRALVGE